ncbi:hypothetical protein JW752_01605 [Candidatus Peregrinibacteria bacterium]|nr:hypothetical protein [Candidatus Peregrinibacteria bacterium]
MKKLFVTILILFSVFLNGCTQPVREPVAEPPETPVGKPLQAIRPAELLADPVYDEDVKLKGTVSLMGELFCPCFQLEADGEFIEVWYDLMAVDSGEPWPKVDVKGIENGDEVIVTGHLRKNTGSLPSKTFWLKSAEKTVEDIMADLIKEEPIFTMTEEESAMMQEGVEEDLTAKQNDDNMVQKMMVMIYDYYGDLANVVKGKTVGNLSFAGIESSGKAEAVFKDGTYYLRAILYEMPIPEDDSFYEGWLVRRGPDFSVISTGKIQLIDSRYVNAYRSGQDLTDHDFYVVTLEPNDGNPAPAVHVLEGLMEKVN